MTTQPKIGTKVLTVYGSTGEVINLRAGEVLVAFPSDLPQDGSVPLAGQTGHWINLDEIECELNA